MRLHFIGIVLIVTFIFLSFTAFSQSGTAQLSATDPRHETLSQQLASVLFDQTILSATTAGWSVTVNGIAVTVSSVAVAGNRVNVTFDATPAHGAQSFIIPGDVLQVSYDQTTGNTLTNTPGNPEINSFTNFLSKNRWSPTCAGDLEYQSEGLAPGSSQDQCSPVNTNYYRWTYAYSMRFRNSSNWSTTANYLDLRWNYLGQATIARAYLSDGAGNPNSAFYITSFQGAFPGVLLTFRPGFNHSTLVNDGVTNPYSYPDNTNICNFRATVSPANAGFFDCVNTAALRKNTQFDSFDFDDHNTGQLNLPPTLAASDRVCLGTNVGMTFTNSTDLNCNGTGDLDVPPNASGSPANSGTRWVRFIYGTLGAAPSGYISDIQVGTVTPISVTDGLGNLIAPYNANPILGGTPGYVFTGAGGPGIPDANGVIELSGPVNEPLSQLTEAISTISTAGHAIQQRFYVTLQFWGPCNRYDLGASPVSTSTSYVEIVTKPNAPAAVDKEYCFTETLGSGGNCGAPTGEYFEVTAASVAGSTEIKWYNTLADANGDANVIGSTYGTNCRFLRPENRTGGTGAMAAAGVYSVFARYRTGAAAPNNCLSNPVEITITRRSSLSTPGAITPLTSDVCDGTNNVPYSLANPAPVVAFGGTTEYSWTFSGGAGATVDAPTTAQNITADYNITGAFLTTSRSLDVVTRFTTNATTGGRCLTTASSRTVTIYGPTLGGTASGGTDYCQGADAANISLAGQNGTVVRWEVNFNSGGFVDAGVGSVITFDPGILPVGNYIYQAVVANGPCSQLNSTTTTINVYPTPTTATAGVDQDLCQPLVTPSAGLGGNVPGTGTGVWSQVSGPGIITFNPTTSTPNATATASLQGIYVVRWTISTGGGLCSSFENVQLDFGAPPAIPDAGPVQDVCATSANLNGTAPTFETGTWSVTAIPVGGTVTFSNVNSPTATVSLSGANVFGTYTLQWQFTSGTCTPEQDIVDITFRQAPTATAPADFTACVDNPPTAPFNINLSGTFGGGASQARWERVSGTGTFTSSGAANGNFDGTNPVDDVYVPTAADFTAGSVQVRLITDDPTGACIAVNDPITITIDRRPANAAAGGDVFTCDPTAGLGATAVNNGGTGTWSVGSALYYETFTETNGLGLSGPNPHALTFTHPTNNWSITAPTISTLLANDDYLRVQSNRMEARDVNAELVWRSSLINITALPNITISLQLMENNIAGNMEPSDHIRVFYSINGGAEILFGGIDDDNAIEGDGVFRTVSVAGLSGNTLEIIVRVENDAADEFHRFDNVFVSSAGASLPLIADINNPTTSVSNLSVGATTFIWTASSALGICSSSMDQVIVTRHASPVNNPQTPALCEDVPTGGTATVTLGFLTSLNNAITGIAGSTGRTIQFFTDPARTIPYPATSSLANTDVVYTIVTRTDVTPNCTTNGTVTFTINSRPAALDQNPEFCEDQPVGSNTRAGIDLTTFNNAVKNNVAANTVAWFSDAALTIPVPAPTNVTANDGTSFFARVTDTNSCTDDAEVQITLNPIPSPNALIGPTNVCVSATAVNLYQLTVNNPGFTYSWSIPDPPFDRVIGGTAADFLVLLSFPVIVNPGQDVSVTEISDKGCVGLPNIVNITVESSPPAITINGPAAVCENEAGVLYDVAFLANTTYAWTVPLGSSIIGGQGTNQITVNFGSTAGLIEVVPTTTTGCAGTPDDLGVAINPRPTLTTLPNTVCSDAPASITLSGTGATSFNITNVSVPPGLSPASRPLINGALSSEIFNDVFTNTTGGNLTVQYTVVPVSALACEGIAQIVNLTIRPEPVLSSGLNDEICSTTDAVGIVLSVASGSFPADQYEVFSVNNPAGLTPVAGNPTTLGVFTSGVLLDDKWQNLTGAVATIEYFIRPINSTTTCVGDPPIPVIVTVNPEPIISAMPPETICSGDSPATIITPSIPGSTFSWTVISVSGPMTGNTNGSGPSGSTITDVLINNGAVSGSVTYAITATGPGGFGSCIGQAENLVVNIDPSPTANSINQIVCSDTPGGNTFFIDLTTLQNSVNGGGGVTFSWFSDLALTTPIAVPAAHTLTSGVPVFVNVDNGQCAKVATILFTINPSPSVVATITSNYSGFQLSCNGASDGQITAVPANGTGPYLFSLDGGGSFFTSAVFNGISVAGNPHTVRVRDANGCIVDSAPLTIVPPTAVSAIAAITSNFNGEDVSCQAASDGVITITPAGGTGTHTFRLLELPSNTTGDINGIYTGLRAGTYTFVVKDANNCQFTTPTITITEPTPVTATATLTSPVSCNGNSDGVITVAAGGGTLVGPSYTFTLNQAPFTVNATGVFSGLAAGNYTVNVEDDNGCARTSNSVSVTQPSVLTAFASVTSNYNGAKISCPGAGDAQVTAIANGGNGGFTFALDQDPLNLTGSADGSFENLGPGTYTITVTDAGTCTVTSASVTVTEPTPILASALVTGTISCNGGSDGQITVSASGGTGAYSFEQINPVGPTNVTGIFPGLPQGTYDFEVSDLNGCSDLVTLTINQPTVVTASAAVTSNYNGSQISCNGNSDGAITVTATGGTGSFTYVFDQSPGNASGQFTGVFTGIQAGTGYTFTVEDVNNCSAISAPIDVVAPAVINVTTAAVTSNYNGQDISCTNASDAEITIVVTGGTPTTPGPTGYTYRLDQEPLNTSGNSTGLYTGISVGSYTVTVRDANNCFIATVPIVIDPYPVITVPASVTSSFNGGRQISCNGASDGEITVVPAGGVAPFTFVINPPINASGLNTGIFTGLVAGTYTITATDLNGCPKTTSSVTIVEPALLSATATVTSNYNGQEISCNAASDGIIRITTTGGTTAYTYTFVEIPLNVSGQANGIFTAIPAGTYTFNVRDVNNCTVTTSPITISEPTPVTASAMVTSNYNTSQISCNGINDGVISITSGGGTGSATYVFDQFAVSNQSGRFSGVFTSVQAGNNYTFTVRDANNCPVVTAPINVTEPAVLNAAGIATSSFNGFNIRCFNETNGQITITATGGTGAINYMLLEDAGNLTGQTSGVFANLRAGSFRARINDVNGCLFTSTPIVVTQPTSIAVTINKTSNYNGFDVSCIGAADGEVSVITTTGGAGGFTYALDGFPGNVTGQASGIFTGIVAGLYTITVTDVNTCTRQSLPVILTDPLPLFEGIVGLDKSICLGANPTAFTELAAAFGGVGNYGYQWQESTDGVIFSNVIGANGATFDPPAVPQTTFYKRLITSGTCVTLESNTVGVTVNPLPTVALAPSKTPVCEGDFFLLEFTFTGQAPFYFDYNDGTTFVNDRLGAANTPVPILNYVNTTTYTVTEVRDFNGCVAPILAAPVTVPVIKINPNFAITSPSAQCSGGVFGFEYTVDPDVEYTWIWGDGQIEVIPANSMATGVQPINHTYNSFNTSGTTNYPVILTAINSVQVPPCGPKQANQTVQVYPNILLNLFPDKNAICGGDDVKFTNPTVGGSSHHWFYREQGVVEMRDERTFVAPSTQTFTLNNTTTQNPIVYELVYEVSNANCAADTVIEIEVYREVAAQFSKTTPVPQFAGGIANMTFTNTSVPVDGVEFRYDWDFGTAAQQGPVSGVGPFNFNYTSPGTKTVTLIAVNLIAQGAGLTCTNQYQETFDILLAPLMADFEYSPQAACFPADINITENFATGDQYTWRLIKTGQSSPLLISNDSLPTFRIVSPGRYTIFLTTRNSITGQSADANNSGSGPNSTGIPIDIYDAPFAAFEALPKILFVPNEELRTFNSSISPTDPQNSSLTYPIDYAWYFDDGTDTVYSETEPRHFYQNEGNYDVSLLAINDHGNGVVCIDTMIQRVQAKAAGFTRIPNAFTPNPSGSNGGFDDGSGASRNDVFLPIMKGIKEFQMQVFDRWGNFVFESKETNRGWDGYDRNGVLMPAGVYVYKLVLRLANDQRTTQIGDITLIR